MESTTAVDIPDGLAKMHQAAAAGPVILMLEIEVHQEKKVPQKTVLPFDLEEGIRKCFNQPDLFEQTVDAFFEEADPLLKRIREAVAKADSKELARLAHRLRGTVAYLAAAPATEAAEKVEKTAMSRNMDRTRPAIAQLEQEVLRLRAALEEYRKNKSGA